MSKELVIAIVNLMFISACMGFLICFFAMGGFNYQPKEGDKIEGDTEIKVEVHYDPPQTEAEPAEPEVIEVKKTSLGTYKLTGYCPCEKCCGVNTGITASGTKATEGRTVGVNPKDIPYGTVLEINGQQYIAEDTGSAIGSKHIDIYFDNHEDALKFGTQKAEVFILEVEE